jgi:enamine deaminase RidA (YjgF/YER057c/UK114 family)
MGARERLAELGLELPEVPAPAAAYVPVVRTGSLVQTAGQLPMRDGSLPATGKVGGEVDVEAAQGLARQAALNALAAAASAVDGDLDRLRVLKLTVFVASTPDFTEQHLVANGASNLVGDVLGDHGVHARSAVGVPVLPLDSPVEVEALVEVLEDAAPQ